MSASIQLPGGLKVLNQQPEITKYFNNNGDPYTSTLEVLAQLTSGLRHIGLTVNINNVEYWFKDGILDSHLVEKIPNVPPQTQSDWNEGSTSSVSYIKNKPDLSIYQPLLIDGLNIKTINNESVLGSGSIIINGGVTSFNSRTGSVTFSISDFISVLNGTGFLKYNNNILSYDNNNFLNINGGTLSGNLGIFSNNPTRQLVLNTNPNTFTQSAQTLISYQRYNVEKALQGLAGFDDNGFKGVKAGDFIYKGTSNIHLGFAQSAGGGDQYGIAPAKVNPALSINNRNYVGINNSNPFYELDILGDVRINGGTYSTTRIDYLSLNDYYFFPSNTTSLTRTVNGNQLTINSSNTSNFVWFGTTQVLSQRDYFLSFTISSVSISSPLVNIYYKINDVVQDSGLSFPYNVGSYTYSFTTPNDVSEVRIYFNRAKSGSFTLTSFNLIEYQGDGQITIFPKNGLSPIITNSSLLNTNLNSDLLDGFHASDFSRTNHVHNNLFDNTLNSTGILVDNGLSNFYGDAYLNKIYGTEIINNGTFSNPSDLSSFGFFNCTGTISSSRLSISTSNLGSAWLLFNVSSTFSQYRVRFANISSTQTPLISGILYVTAGNIWDTDFGGSSGFTYSTGSTLDFEFVAKYSGTVRVYLLRNSSTGRTVVFDDVSVRQVTKFGDITANKFIKIGSTSSQFLMGDGSTNTLKTINNQSLLGVGNIDIQSGVTSFNGRTGSVTLNITDVKNADTNIELAYKGTNSYVVDKNGNFLNATYSIKSNYLVDSFGDKYLELNINGTSITGVNQYSWALDREEGLIIGLYEQNSVALKSQSSTYSSNFQLYSMFGVDLTANNILNISAPYIGGDVVIKSGNLTDITRPLTITSSNWSIDSSGAMSGITLISENLTGSKKNLRFGIKKNPSYNVFWSGNYDNPIDLNPTYEQLFIRLGQSSITSFDSNSISITDINAGYAQLTFPSGGDGIIYNFPSVQNMSTGITFNLLSDRNVKTINGQSIVGVGGITISTTPVGITGSIQFNSGSIFGGTSSFIYDSINGRLGIGVTSSNYIIDVRSSSSTALISAINSNASGKGACLGASTIATGMYFDGSGYFLIGSITNSDLKAGTFGSSTTRFQIFANGNTLIQSGGGSYNDNGYRLQVVGELQSGVSANGILSLSQTWNTSGNPTALLLSITGTQSGNTSKLIDLQIGSASMFNIIKDGIINYKGNLIPNSTNGLYALGISSANSMAKINVYTNGGGSAIQSFEFGYFSTSLNSDGNFSNPVHNNFGFRIYGNYTVSGIGGGSYTTFLINPTLNFISNANPGIMRGIFYNPTLTSLSNTTHRAIETISGDVLLGVNSGIILLGTSTNNGVDKLQVNGSVMANSYKTSTGTSNDVLLGDGTTVTKGVLANSSASAKNICMVQTII